jgi:fructose-bisphosphate aldolase, class II
MPLVKALDVYRRAREGGYAIGGFCAENLEMIQAIVGAAEDTRSPLVLMLWQEDILSVGPGYLEAIGRYAAERCFVPVALMVDHATSLEFCRTCIANGHSGVMIDASHLPLAQNIALTRQVCDLAHPFGVLVEGELGTVRRSFEVEGPYAERMVFTNPDDVAQFVGQSGADALAVSIGTESGNTQAPELDYARLHHIAELTDVYLVLHGGSGTPAEAIQRLVREGVTAMRFASALRVAFLDAVEQGRAALGRDYPDTRRIYGPARDSVRALVGEYMLALGCAGKAEGWSA